MQIQVEACEEQSHKSARSRARGRYKYIEKTLLEELYIEQGNSTVEIAKTLGVCRNTVWQYMELHGILRRKCGEGGAQKVRRFPKTDLHFFDRIDNPDKAYILGFILGDGHLTWTNGSIASAKRIHIVSVKSDGHLLEDIARLMGCEGAVFYPKPSKNDLTTWERKAVLDINCTRIVEDLERIGVPFRRKSGKEPFLYFVDDKMGWAFLRGVFDADGNIRVYDRTNKVKGKWYTNRRCKFSITIGRPFVEGLVAWLKRLGFTLPPKCAHPKSGCGTWVFEISNSKTLKKIREHLYQNGSLYLKRKKDIFDLL